jgi:hypothetical protein
MSTESEPELDQKLKIFYSALDDTNTMFKLTEARIEEDTLLHFHT